MSTISTATKSRKTGCIAQALLVLGDKWSPLLVKSLAENSLGFSDLEKSLEGISPRTLSQRITKLSDQGIITKCEYCEHPVRYAYSLTTKGYDLVHILDSMADWGEKYSDTTEC